MIFKVYQLYTTIYIIANIIFILMFFYIINLIFFIFIRQYRMVPHKNKSKILPDIKTAGLAGYFHHLHCSICLLLDGFFLFLSTFFGAMSSNWSTESNFKKFGFKTLFTNSSRTFSDTFLISFNAVSTGHQLLTVLKNHLQGYL